MVIDIEAVAIFLAVVGSIIGGLWKIFSVLDSISNEVTQVNNRLTLKVTKCASILKLIDFRIESIENHLESDNHCDRRFTRRKNIKRPSEQSGAKFLDNFSNDDT
jgi:hypothetical protein